MKIVIHRGTHEIGGTCIEVMTGSTRLILDLGLPLVTPNREPFDGSAALRKSVDELLADKTAPNIAGLFDEEHAVPDAILLSHAHLDHMGLIHLSRPEVPVYATKGTSKMMLAGAVFANREGLSRDRHRPVTPGIPFQIGDATITAFAVDHSTFGSVAFLIETAAGRLLYSGDLRDHGRKPGMMKALLAELKAKPVDVLIVEGTHLGGENDGGKGEYDLEEEVVRHVQSADSLVMYCFSPQDVDRLVTAIRASVRTGRTFVADAYAAFILHLIHPESKTPRPKREHGIRVLFNAGFQKQKNRKLEELFASDRIDIEAIQDSPSRYLMAFRPSMTNLDFRGTLPTRCRVLYGYWKGYLKNRDWIDLQEQVRRADGDFITAHTSGHIYVRDLIRFIEAVNAKTVIPVHTFEPDVLGRHFANVRVLNDGSTFEIGDEV